MSDWFSNKRSGKLGPALESLQTEINRVFTDFGFQPPSGSGTQGGQGGSGPDGGGQSASGGGFGGFGGFGSGGSQIRTDVIHTPSGGFELHAELPGVEEGDIDLSVDGDTLTIRAERRASHDEGRRSYRVRERSQGVVSRSVALPFDPDPDTIDAEFRNGLLIVKIERPQPAQGRGSRVNIRSGGGGSSGGGAATGVYGGSTGATGQTESSPNVGTQPETASQGGSAGDQTGGVGEAANSTGGSAGGMLGEGSGTGGSAEQGRAGGMAGEGF